MFAWLNEFLEIRATFRERKRNTIVCESCETLKLQLSISNDNNKAMLDRLLDKSTEEVRVNDSELKPVLPNRLPWRVRQQHLEAEDRDRAKKLAVNKIPTVEKISTEDLEKELDIVESERTSAIK